MNDNLDYKELFTFCCVACGKTVKDTVKPNYCPKCGKSELRYYYDSRSRETALRYISEIQERYRDALMFWKAFAKRYAVIEDKMQILRVYEKRGVISSEEIPSLDKPSLSSALKEYRAEKNREENFEEV